MAASGTDEASEFASDGEDVMLIPEEVMQQARLAMEEGDHHEIIGLRQDGRGFVVEANATALKRLSSQADEIEPYWAVSCLGSTGTGKSFFIAKLLQALGHTGSAPYSIDFSETEIGDIPISVTCNILCYLAGSKLLFDVEGTDGTLPLMQRILMGIGARLRLTAKEKRMQIKRRDAVSKFFPPIAFAISNTVIYITRESLKNSSTSQAIKEFAVRIAGSSTSVRPYLVIIHNLCPINQLRRGKESEAALVKEFLHTHDDSNFLAETFRGVWCMTFPDCNVVDKRKHIDGEAVFDEQLTRLCQLLSQQYDENKFVRRSLHCALPPRSLLTILPEIVRQTNFKKPISIPDILRTNLKNNPDMDCLVLRRAWRTVCSLRSGEPEILQGQVLKDVLSLCIGISAHYLARKLAAQDKAGFPDQWIEEQAASLHDKLMDYFNMVFARCQAKSPHSYDDANGPVRCGAKLLGHDCHITKDHVIPSRFNWFRRNITLPWFGGIFDRWGGEFEFDPVLRDAGDWGKKIMQEEAVNTVNLLRVSTPPEDTTSEAGVSACRSSPLGFRHYNARHLHGWCELFRITPKVAKKLEGNPNIFDEHGTLWRLHPFCCVCFGLVKSKTEDLHICSECISVCDSSMGIRTRFPRAWSCHCHYVDSGLFQVHFVSDADETQVFKDALKVTQPDELGKGHDAEKGLPRYTGLELKHIWRVEDTVQWQKYESSRSQVVNDLKVVKGIGERKGLSTRLDAATRRLLQEADIAAGGVMLLHGTKPEFVLPILHRGMNERLASGEAAFGTGIYLCEDPEKMDQYCRPATRAQARQLQEHLFVSGHGKNFDTRHESRIRV